MAFITPLPLTSSRFCSRATTRIRPLVRAAPSRSQPRMLVLEAGGVDDMDKILKAADESLVVIDYSTSWCGPCKVFAPVFEEMSETYKDVVFVKVMGDANPDSSELMRREGIRAVPAFHFWKNEKRVKDFTGGRREDLEKAILALK